MTPPAARLTPDDLTVTDAARLRDRIDDASTVTVGDVTVEVSDHARAVLAEILDRLAAGDEVDVTPLPEMLTTQEAADLLRVSRPTLVKMLEDGLLPYEQPGVHRRVPRAAVEQFLASRRERRKSALDALAETHDPDGPDEVVRTR
jgi:excisionase family DNA binding protein